jgi:photosystem II stability/assembly factor-like uncharacterized protein
MEQDTTSSQHVAPAGESTARWEPVNPGGGGWFMCVGAGPTGIVIVCSDVSGAYRSLDRGQSWDVIGSYRGLKFTHVSAVGFDPQDENIIYLGIDGALYRSSDKGETFQNKVEGGYWTAIAISPADPRVGYAAWQSGWRGLNARIYKTTDRGLTWEKAADAELPEGLRILRLIPHPENPDVLYLVSGEHRFVAGIPALFRSVDGGIHWEQVAADLGPIVDMTLDPDNPQTLFVTVEGRGVFKSSDEGSTWTHQAEIWGRIFAKSSQVLRIINNDGVWETVDGGETWGIKSTEADWTEPGWQPAWHFGSGPGTSIGGDLSDPDTYYWVNQQFVYGSFDGGLTFRGLHTREVPPGSNQWQSTGIDNTEVYDLEISKAVPNLIYIGLWDMGIWRSRDHGDIWQSCNQDEFGWEGGRGGDVWTILTDPARPEVVWAGSLRTASNGRPSSHLIRSDNFGEPGSWRETGDGLPNPQLAAEIWGLSLAPNSPTDRRTLFVTAGNAVYRSQDDGNHWEKVFSGGRARITAVDFADNNLVYAGGDGGFWRSPDGGDTWEKTGLPEMRGIFDIKPDPSNPGWVYVTCYGNDLGLYRSKDGGATWEKLWTNNVARGVAIHPSNPDVIFVTSSLNDCCGAGATGSAGVMRSTDGGQTWQEVNEGLPWPFGWPIEFDPHDPAYVFLGSPGTGYYRRQFAQP